MILTRVSSGKKLSRKLDISSHFVRLRKMRTFQSVSRNKKCEDFAKENIMQKYRNKIQNLIKNAQFLRKFIKKVNISTHILRKKISRNLFRSKYKATYCKDLRTTRR